MIKKIIVVAAMGASVLTFVGCKDNPTNETTAATTAAATTAATTATTAATTASSNAVDEAAAKLIALEHAGLREAEVVINELGKELEDGLNVIKIEFTKGNEKYEYLINEATGEIVKSEKEAAND